MQSKIARLTRRADKHRQRGRHGRALTYLRQACDLAPNDPLLWVERGETATHLGQRDDAVRSLFRAADIYARRGIMESALRASRSVLALDPEHRGARRFVTLFERRLAERGQVDQRQLGTGSQPVCATLVSTQAKATAFRTYTSAAEQSSDVARDVAEAREQASSNADPSNDVVEIVAELPEAPRARRSAPRELTSPRVARVFRRPGKPPRRARPGVGRRKVSVRGRLQRPADTRVIHGVYAAAPPIASQEAARVLGSVNLDDVLPARIDGNHLAQQQSEEQALRVLETVAGAASSSPLLSELDSDLVKFLVTASRKLDLDAGQLVFKQGATGGSLYLILRGSADVERRDSATGGLRRLATLRAGSFFGEMSLLTGAPRSASVRAHTAVSLLEVPREALHVCVQRNDRILKLLMRFFRARLVGNVLASGELFRSVESTQRQAMITRFHLRELPPGYLVVERGVVGDGLYIVLMGQLNVFIGLEDDSVARLGPGDVFGEMSLLEDAPAMASIKSEGKVWLLSLARREFDRMVFEHPQVYEELAEIAAERRGRNIATGAT